MSESESSDQHDNPSGGELPIQHEAANDVASPSKSKRKRHGARNQHRHKNMIKWIVKTFPEPIKEAKEKLSPVDTETTNDQHHTIVSTENYRHVLDVAGGKGELSARLTLCHTLNVRMVDPRPADIYECFNKLVFRSLPKKWQQRIISQDPSIIQGIVHRRFEQFVKCFPMDGSHIIQELQNDDELLTAVKNSSLIIGMHADGATEAIVDIALHFRKPFVVVPCCVFPNLFRHRQVPLFDADNPNVVKKMITVRNHEQFCQYLALKDKNFVVETLPFEGRNTAIWWDGRHREDD